MASSNGQSDGEKFPAADILQELNPAQNRDVNVDPVSSQITASLQNKVFIIYSFICNLIL